jgi:hypothetical protein
LRFVTPVVHDFEGKLAHKSLSLSSGYTAGPRLYNDFFQARSATLAARFFLMPISALGTVRSAARVFDAGPQWPDLGSR